MPSSLRSYIDPITLRIGRIVGKVVRNPNIITVLGFIIGAASGPLLMKGMITAAAVALLISGAFDMLDGAVARALNRVSKAGAFLDSNLDRLVEASLYFGIGFLMPHIAYLSFLAFAFSVMVSYSRARVEGLACGSRPKSLEIGERGIRLLIMILLMIFGLIELGLLVVTFLAAETFLERLVIYYRFLKKI